MKARRLVALLCAGLSGCALAGSYDFDGYSPAPPTAGAGGVGVSGSGGVSPGGKGGAAGTMAGGGGAIQGGAGQAGVGGAAGAGAGGQTGAGQAGAGGTQSGGNAGQSGGGGNAGVSGSSQAGQGGTAGGAAQGGGAGQSGSAQGGAGQGGNEQGGAAQGGAGGCAQPTTWYRDGDFDGHGTPLLSSVVACAKPADEPGNYQWVAVADDCNDANKDVFPGQTDYFGTPYAKPGAPADLSFDYDCDGKESPIAQTFAPACSGLSLGSCAGTGYVPYKPSRSGSGIGAYCGSTATISCVKQPIFCVSGAETPAGALACR